jgi:hypothetical protein
VNGQLHAPAALIPGKELQVPIRWELRWTPESVWTIWKVTFPDLTGTRTSTRLWSSPQPAAMPTALSRLTTNVNCPVHKSTPFWTSGTRIQLCYHCSCFHTRWFSTDWALEFVEATDWDMDSGVCVQISWASQLQWDILPQIMQPQPMPNNFVSYAPHAHPGGKV